MSAATHDPKGPSRRELADREEAVENAGGPAPPRARSHGFQALAGQETVVESLTRALAGGHLPHALLFHGPQGVGKATCAGILAQAVNCPEAGPADACGQCLSCRKVARGLHPDVQWIVRDPERKVIRIEQIKEQVVGTVSFRPYEGRRRVVVIDDAHEMNPSSQNALLKTLEEPPPAVVLVLVTPAPSSLLPTVRSRCQQLRFRPLPAADLRRHLEEVAEMEPGEARLRAALSAGSVGRALDLDLDLYRDRRTLAEETLRDAVQGGASLLTAAEKLLSEAPGDRKIEQATAAMVAVRDVLRDLLVLSTGADESLLVNADRADPWRRWSERLDAGGLVEALEAVQRADDRLHGAVQPNARLAVEQALVEAAAALRGPAGRGGPAAGFR